MVLINNCFLEQYVSVPMVTLALASCNRQECKFSSSIGECDHGTITFNVIVSHSLKDSAAVANFKRECFKMMRGLVDWRLMGKMEKHTKVKSPTSSPKAIYGCGSSGTVDLRV